MIVGIRGRCRLEGESDTYMSLSNVKGALYSFFPSTKVIFSHWVLLLLGKVFNETTWKALSSCDRHKGEC